MNRGLVRLLAVALLLAGGLWATGTSWLGAARAAPPAERGLEWQGTASCASAACHNANGPPGTRGSEYTTWVTLDPHAQAFEVLHTGRSRRIEKDFRQLARLEDAHAERDDLCLKCHAMSDAAPRRASFSIEDGVGCESCHGPAEHWLTQHYQRGWQGLTNADKAALGFRLTGGDLVRRAEVCVTCHVGAADREVNHDLIAAGHPRLRFEFGAYHANLPKHWNTARDKAGRPDFEAQAWAVGQMVSARAALELVAARADPASGKPWPEFAEYDCFACHHDLAEPSWRQQRKPEERRSGALHWGTWYFAPTFQDALDLAGGGRKPEELAALKKQMETWQPDRGNVTKRAQTASSALSPAGRGKGVTPERISRLGEQFAGDSRDEAKLADWTWDNEAQRYLGMAALHNALSDWGRTDIAFRKQLLKLRGELRFREPYNSPHGYDPFARTKPR